MKPVALGIVLRSLLLAVMPVFLAGCPYIPPETRNPHLTLIEPVTKNRYYLYVPSYYSADRDWPLVVTLHGTNPYDGQLRQILEWKDIAEQFGLIVVAPKLESTQGYAPAVPNVWHANREKLARDEKVILSVIQDVRHKRRIARRPPGPDSMPGKDLVLLTGFSSGGFPLFYVGLRNPDMFDMLIARDCNCTTEMIESLTFTDEAKKLPILIFWGRDDMEAIRDQSWATFRFLREHEFYGTERKSTQGGHLRRPDVAWSEWSKRLPKEYRE
jgi:predicted peptidase